jgi:hypothetical protein
VADWLVNHYVLLVVRIQTQLPSFENFAL